MSYRLTRLQRKVIIRAREGICWADTEVIKASTANPPMPVRLFDVLARIVTSNYPMGSAAVTVIFTFTQGNRVGNAPKFKATAEHRKTTTFLSSQAQGHVCTPTCGSKNGLGQSCSTRPGHWGFRYLPSMLTIMSR